MDFIDKSVFIRSVAQRHTKTDIMRLKLGFVALENTPRLR
jgi:hypothetical protein